MDTDNSEATALEGWRGQVDNVFDEFPSGRSGGSDCLHERMRVPAEMDWGAFHFVMREAAMQ